MSLRIAYLISHFPPVIGGAEVQAAHLARAFAGHGHQVTVITRLVPGAPTHEEKEPGVRVIRVRTGLGGRLAALRYLVLGFRALVEFGPFDVVQSSQLGSASFLGLLWQKCTGTPLVAKPEGSELQAGPRLWHPRTLLLKLAAGIIAITPHLHDRLRFLKGRHSQLTCIPNAVPDVLAGRVRTRETPSPRAAQRSLTFLFVGRMEKVKGPDVLVETWTGAPELHRHSLLMVGEGSLRRELVAQTRGCPSIRWLGQVAQVHDLLTAADVFVNCSRDEGLPLAVLEAMSAGLTVVAADLPGNRYALTSEGHCAGILVDPGDVRAFRMALEQVAGSNELRDRFSLEARRRCQHHFHLDQAADQYLAFYRHVIGQ